MEVLHSFTDAAEQQLRDELGRLGDELREQAIAEAFKTRGKPVEVTASDVRKASQRLFSQQQEVAKRYPQTLRFLRVYLGGGILLVVGGVVVFLLDSFGVLVRSSPLFAVLLSGGGFMLLFSIAVRQYLKMNTRRRNRERDQ